MYEQFLGKYIDIIIDRPAGSKHPKEDLIYPINYGYIPDTIAEDGHEIDVYAIDSTVPAKCIKVKIIGIVKRNNDTEKKLVGIESNKKFTKDEIMGIIYFQEQYFDSFIEQIYLS